MSLLLIHTPAGGCRVIIHSPPGKAMTRITGDTPPVGQGIRRYYFSYKIWKGRLVYSASLLLPL